MAEFPESGITYGTTPVPSGYWEKLGRLLNNSVFYDITNQDFGADPSGVADSGSAIAAAWAAAPAYSTIYYPPSNSGQALYKITSVLNHPNKPLYHYTPKWGAVIKNTGTGELFESQGADRFVIDGLVFDSDYGVRTTNRGGCLSFANSTDFRVTNVRVQNSSANGIAIQGGCSRFCIDHYQVDTTYDSGIWFGNGGTIENFWVTDGWMTGTNANNTGGNAGIQCVGGGATVTRKGHFRDILIEAYTRVAYGLDYLTDSELIDCEARGEHTGEALALTGARNRIRGGRFGESTGAAGLLLWCVTGTNTDATDTTISGVYIPGPVGGGNQGIALVAGSAGTPTMKGVLIEGCRVKGWSYGIQNYLFGGTDALADDGTVLIRGNHLTGNSSGAYLFASPFTPVLRDNLTAADTIDTA